MKWEQVEEYAAEAAYRALGFGPHHGRVTLSAEEVAEIANRAAYIALAFAGQVDGDKLRFVRTFDRPATRGMATSAYLAAKCKGGGA